MSISTYVLTVFHPENRLLSLEYISITCRSFITIYEPEENNRPYTRFSPGEALR